MIQPARLAQPAQQKWQRRVSAIIDHFDFDLRCAFTFYIARWNMKRVETIQLPESCSNWRGDMGKRGLHYFRHTSWPPNCGAGHVGIQHGSRPGFALRTLWTL